jgi:hypothetical protein
MNNHLKKFTSWKNTIYGVGNTVRGLRHAQIQRRLKSIRENKMADVNEFELLLFAPLKYTR